MKGLKDSDYSLVPQKL